MEKKSKHEKSIDELTPAAPAPSFPPLGMDGNPPTTNILPTPLPTSFFPLLNDSTSHIEISSMENDKYSEEIINDARKVFNLEKLRGLRQDKNKFYKEAKIQINKLCQSIDALDAHNQLFKVTFLINLGYLLNEIEPTFQKKAAYINWRKNNFVGRSPEYFQHARRLSKMGETAIKYRSLGVNRLLDVDRLQRTLGKSLDEILKEHSFLDTAQDFSGELFKARVDAIITYYRFINAGVDNIKMEQALQLAQYFHKAVEVKEVNRFKKKYDEAADKDVFLEKYVMDKMALTEDEKSITVSEKSLDKMLSELNDYFEKRINDSEWLTDLKDLMDRNIFDKAYGHLTWLKKKLKHHPHKG